MPLIPSPFIQEDACEVIEERTAKDTVVTKKIYTKIVKISDIDEQIKKAQAVVDGLVAEKARLNSLKVAKPIDEAAG